MDDKISPKPDINSLPPLPGTSPFKKLPDPLPLKPPPESPTPKNNIKDTVKKAGLVGIILFLMVSISLAATMVLKKTRQPEVMQVETSGIPGCLAGCCKTKDDCEGTERCCNQNGACVPEDTCGGYSCGQPDGGGCSQNSDCCPGLYCDTGTHLCTESVPNDYSCTDNNNGTIAIHNNSDTTVTFPWGINPHCTWTEACTEQCPVTLDQGAVVGPHSSVTVGHSPYCSMLQIDVRKPDGSWCEDWAGCHPNTQEEWDQICEPSPTPTHVTKPSPTPTTSLVCMSPCSLSNDLCPEPLVCTWNPMDRVSRCLNSACGWFEQDENCECLPTSTPTPTPTLPPEEIMCTDLDFSYQSEEPEPHHDEDIEFTCIVSGQDVVDMQVIEMNFRYEINNSGTWIENVIPNATNIESLPGNSWRGTSTYNFSEDVNPNEETFITVQCRGCAIDNSTAPPVCTAWPCPNATESTPTPTSGVNPCIPCGDTWCCGPDVSCVNNMCVDNT
jgi:hypothetical protein